ncbi:MAG TPA: hypothetical protein VGN86_12955 [Pyrinomonadaceae bacterium]|jgi:hypothetical protein|nr:hypothetical protein [Pyrinomonadaceae bacterium]
MAIVQGIREKVHLPIYDSVSVEGGKQFRDAESTSILKFFVDVQKKTKLETNLQSASLLPHYNTFEARAMRVVISDLPPEFPEEQTSEPKSKEEPFDVFVQPTPPEEDPGDPVYAATIELGVKRLMELLEEARENDGEVELPATDPGVVPEKKDPPTKPEDDQFIPLSVSDLEKLIASLDRFAPSKEQIRPNNGAGTIIGKLIYNTVTTLYVGEKIMIQMPTWFFPAGAGPYSESGHFTTHGQPSPTATFRFAEPIFIDKQQNFRVEIEIPDSDTLKEIQRIYGPLNLWVVLDGYMTRDVQ